MNSDKIIIIIIQLVALVLSIILHEIAHGFVAWKLGDPTAKQANRLSLNPLRHIDPFGSIILPLILVVTGSPVLLGWAKPVPFNPGYFKNIKQGVMAVGAAGPMTNFTIGFLAAFIFRFFDLTFNSYAGLFLGQLCVINIILAVFNLIPIPPLDGSRVVVGLMPDNMAKAYLSLERYGFIIIFALLYAGALDKIIFPIGSTIIKTLLNL